MEHDGRSRHEWDAILPVVVVDDTQRTKLAPVTLVLPAASANLGTAREELGPVALVMSMILDTLVALDVAATVRARRYHPLGKMREFGDAALRPVHTAWFADRDSKHRRDRAASGDNVPTPADCDRWDWRYIGQSDEGKLGDVLPSVTGVTEL